MTPAYLFVYGTLRRGSANRHARLLESAARFLGSARTAGRLYSFGRHPGAVRSEAPGEWVRGEVFLLKNPAQTLCALDRYEGAKYERVGAQVELPSGKQITAWVYFLRREPSAGRIATGEWI
ncbi:MAG TPA: gamma-glutamylcyclotransferase family protein [Bryobacteraceae bacterium]|nr:gamma-glutamylcyclotransferase family protein [Bryobacteraceae bacterium]